MSLAVQRINSLSKFSPLASHRNATRAQAVWSEIRVAFSYFNVGWLSFILNPQPDGRFKMGPGRQYASDGFKDRLGICDFFLPLDCFGGCFSNAFLNHSPWFRRFYLQRPRQTLLIHHGTCFRGAEWLPCPSTWYPRQAWLIDQSQQENWTCLPSPVPKVHCSGAYKFRREIHF